MKYLSFIFLYVFSFLIRPFIKIDKNLLLFSARGGMGFEDNPKYLFLYAVKNTKYRCIWITKNKIVLESMKKNGYESYYYLSKEAFLYTLQANGIFISHSITDVMPVFFNKKTKVINLWHGIPIKKIALLDKHQTLKSRMLYKIYKYGISYFISNHDDFVDIYKNSFALNSSQIISLGLPRIDYLKHPSLFGMINKDYFARGYKVYLYAPTFRDYNFINPILNEETMSLLDKKLQLLNAKLYIKLHPQDTYALEGSYLNITLLDVPDIYECLNSVDVLISDYSSIILDYISAFPNKKLVIYTPDIKDYLKERGFNFNFDIYFKHFIVEKENNILSGNKNHNFNYNLNKDHSCKNIISLVE